jgi:hypothetical protein
VINLIGNVVNLDNQEPVPPEPPVIPPSDPPVLPPVPPTFGGVNQFVPFDHLTLPRLPVQPSRVLNANVQRVVILLEYQGGVLDISPAFQSGEWNQPITGEARGTIELVDVLASNGDRLLDLITAAKVGARITWVQIFGDTFQKVVCNAYLLNKPYIVQDDEFRTITLEIGCQLSLLSKRQWLRDIPYCGKPPANVKQAVRIYESFLRVPILATDGHPLVNPPENFSSESPYDFLQGLYAPTDQDVRCNLSGIIQVFPRQKYQAGNVLTTYVPISTPQPDSSLLFNSLKLTNTFTKVQPFTARNETFTELSPTYDVNNTKPWYLNGSWRKVTVVRYLGDTEVFRREEYYGRFPNAVTYSAPSTSASITGVIVPESEIDSTCENGVAVYDTTERLIYITESALKTVKHRSGALLVTRKTEQQYGWGTFAGEGETLFYNGMINKSVEEFTNTPIPNENTCRKDYQHVTTLRVFSRYERHPLSNLLILVEREVDAYRDVTRENELTNGLSRSVPKSWASVQLRGKFTDGYWVEQPSRRGIEEPSESQWVRPTTIDVTVSGIATDAAIQKAIGFKPASPSDAPHCYRPIQCQRLAFRQIRDSYAIANSLEVLVPYYQNFNLGDSIDIPDLNYQGQIYGITYKQDGTNAEQTLTLGKIEK